MITASKSRGETFRAIRSKLLRGEPAPIMALESRSLTSSTGAWDPTNQLIPRRFGTLHGLTSNANRPFQEAECNRCVGE